METILFEVIFYDGRKFRIFCQGRNQIKRFRELVAKKYKEIDSINTISNGMHTIAQFEKLLTIYSNKLL